MISLQQLGDPEAASCEDGVCALPQPPVDTSGEPDNQEPEPARSTDAEMTESVTEST